MNPFDDPPATPAVSFDPPRTFSPHRRRRTVTIGIASALVVAGGVAGISQLVGADRPAASTAVSPPAEGDDEPPATTDPEPPATPEQQAEEPVDPAPAVDVDGEIVIDVGDDEPIVLDLSELDVGGPDLGGLAECLGFDLRFSVEAGPGQAREVPALDDWFDDWFDEWFDELAAPGEIWAPGALDGRVTVLGPDGATVIDLGEGDGSVTITRNDGDIEITTDGDATVHDPAEWLSEIEERLGDLIAPGQPPGHDRFDQLFENLPTPDEIESCLAEWRAGAGE